MPLATPVTIADISATLKTRLEEWAGPRGGQVAVMANQRHLWEALTSLPDPLQLAPRLMILYAGETLMLPDQPDCHRVDRSWQVVVVRGRGFADLRDPMSGGVKEPFTTSLEAVRDLIRTTDNISDFEAYPSVLYKGMKPLPGVLKSPEANAFMDGMIVEFNTVNDILAVTDIAPGTETLTGGELPP